MSTMLRRFIVGAAMAITTVAPTPISETAVLADSVSCESLTQAPTTVIASKGVNGQTQKTHLLCPYLQEAVLKGSGSPDDAASFECRLR